MTSPAPAPDPSHESEATLRQLLDGAIDTVIIGTDPQGRVTSWNEGARRIIGYDREEMLGRPIDVFFTPEDRAGGRLQEELSEARALGYSEYEGWRVRKSGQLFWASGQMSPLRDDNGAITGFVKIVRDRTAERTAADALEASQEQLRMAQAAGGIGLFVVDIGSDMMTVTPEFCRMFGIPQSPVIDPAVGEATILDEDRAMASSNGSRRAGSAIPDVEYRIRRPIDGEIRWIARSAEFVLDEAGAPVQMRGTCQDITARKQVEQSLRESEAQFRTFAQAMANHVWTAPADGLLDWFNDPVFVYTGLTHADLIGEGWARMVHPEDLAGAAAAWSRALTSGERYETEFRIRRADGVYRWHLVRAVPIHGESGIVRWVGTNTDIEDQRLALDALARSNQSLEGEVAARTADRDRIWSLSADVMLVADLEGHFTAVNPAWERLFGWGEADLLGSAFLDLVHPEDLEPTLAEMARLEQGITTLRFENRFRGRDGSYRPLSWTAVPEAGFIHAVGRDITAEQAAAAELQQAHEALRQSQKMEAVGQLTGGIAHDFNNLLTIITGNMDMAVRRLGEDADPRVKRALTNALIGAERAGTLTQRLLAFSRRQSLDPRPTDVARLIAGMSELLTRALGETVSIETVAGAGLWRVEVDTNQLENALLNLAVNARDAMPEGGKLTIEVANAQIDKSYADAHPEVAPGSYIAIAVSDTGMGMSRETIARAFDPFYTTKEVGKGTGLGLSMVYGFVKQSGGHVKIYSEAGEGTTIKLYLPRHLSDDDLPEEPAAEEGVETSDGSETILVVEDDDDVRTFSVESLRELGYRVLEAHDGPSALRLIERQEQPIHLLFTDVVMPAMSGRELADAASRLLPNLQILYTSGYTRNAIAHAGRLDRGVELLPKPFTFAQLSAKVRDLLDRARFGRIMVIDADADGRSRLRAMLDELGFATEETASLREALGLLRINGARYDAVLVQDAAGARIGTAVDEIHGVRNSLPLLILADDPSEPRFARFADVPCIHVLARPFDAPDLEQALGTLRVVCAAAG